MSGGVRPPPVHLGLGEDQFEAAVVARRAHLDRIEVERARAPLVDLVAAYLDAKVLAGDHRSAATTRADRTNLRRVVDYFRMPLSRIRSEDIVAWRRSMEAERRAGGRALSPETIRSYMRSAGSFFSWLVERGEIGRSPFDGMKRALPRGVTRRGKACDKATRDGLIEGCDCPHLRVVLALGFLSGMRRGEILACRSRWVELRDGRPARIHVQNEDGSDGGAPFLVKWGKPRVVPVCEPLAGELLRYGLGGDPYLVNPEMMPGENKYRWDWKRAWATYMRKMGQPRWVTPHAMRHTYISLMLSAERPPSVLHLSRWTGVGVKTLQETYAHLFEDEGLINAAN